MQQQQQQQQQDAAHITEMVINGKQYRRVNVHERVMYDVSHDKASKHRSLMDQGANGGLADEDVCIINKTNHCVDVSGIDDHKVTDLPIVTAGGVFNSQ